MSYINDTTEKCPSCEAYVDKSEMVYSEVVDDRICSCCFEDEKDKRAIPAVTETALHPVFENILRPYFSRKVAG